MQHTIYFALWLAEIYFTLYNLVVAIFGGAQRVSYFRYILIWSFMSTLQTLGADYKIYHATHCFFWWHKLSSHKRYLLKGFIVAMYYCYSSCVAIFLINL